MAIARRQMTLEQFLRLPGVVLSIDDFFAPLSADWE